MLTPMKNATAIWTDDLAGFQIFPIGSCRDDITSLPEDSTNVFEDFDKLIWQKMFQSLYQEDNVKPLILKGGRHFFDNCHPSEFVIRREPRSRRLRRADGEFHSLTRNAPFYQSLHEKPGAAPVI